MHDINKDIINKAYFASSLTIQNEEKITIFTKIKFLINKLHMDLIISFSCLYNILQKQLLLLHLKSPMLYLLFLNLLDHHSLLILLINYHLDYLFQTIIHLNLYFPYLIILFNLQILNQYIHLPNSSYKINFNQFSRRNIHLLKETNFRPNYLILSKIHNINLLILFYHNQQ